MASITVVASTFDAPPAAARSARARDGCSIASRSTAAVIIFLRPAGTTTVAPGVGAMFTGHNRNGEFEWTTECEVTEWVPGRVFAFDGVFGDLRFAKWGYRIEPTAKGCRVTEWSEDLRPDSALEFSKEMSGVEDRHARNHETMSGTLERLATALEG